MPLKKSDGNMYPWVTHTHSHLGGECPHHCSYCYVTVMSKRFPNMAARYGGPVKLIEAEFDVDYGTGRTIFIEHMNDLFADSVPVEFIHLVLDHCARYPENTYVFQTKNPDRYGAVDVFSKIPSGAILGTTIESQYFYPEIMRSAPRPVSRYMGMLEIAELGCFKTFVTVEPILDFDPEILSSWLLNLRPDFVNIGADSKGTGLPEPSAEKVNTLIRTLQSAGIEIREKHNLGRILNHR